MCHRCCCDDFKINREDMNENMHTLINKCAVVKVFVRKIEKDGVKKENQCYLNLLKKGMSDVEYAINRLAEREL